MSHIVIREAGPEDADGAATIMRELEWLSCRFKEGHSESAQRAAETFARHKESEQSLALVALVEGEVAAFASVAWVYYASVSEPEAFVTELYVLEERRGQGVGKALIAEIKRRAKERGAFRLNLFSGRESEAYTRAFYPGEGFTERPSVANFILPLAAAEPAADAGPELGGD